MQKGYKQARVKQNKIISGRKAVPLNSIYSLNIDKCNQENIVCASLGICILRDIFKAMQKEYKQARFNKLIHRQET